MIGSTSTSNPFAAAYDAMRSAAVSVREALESLAANDEELPMVAAVLRNLPRLKYAYIPKHAPPSDNDGREVSALLYHVCETGTIGPTDNPGVGVPCDPANYGWYRAELVAALRDHTPPILVNDRLEFAPRDTNDQSVDEDSKDQWLLQYGGEKWISLGEAATILSGFSPTNSYRWGGDERIIINQWRNTLRRASKRYIYGQKIGFIRNNGNTQDRGWDKSRSWRRECEEDKLKLWHADIRTWCEKNGYHWPIPAATETSTSQSELVRKLREAEAERDALYDASEERDALRSALRAREEDASNSFRKSFAQIVCLKGELDTAKQEIERLSNRLVGKNRDIARLEKTIVRNSVQAAVLQEDMERQFLKVRELLQQHEPRANHGEMGDRIPPRPAGLMEMAIATQQRYWGENWNESDKDTWTAQKSILAWLKETYPSISDKQRAAVEQVACPVNRDKAKKVPSNP